MYHEGVPGHHLQIGLAGELDHLAEFRRTGRITSYSEGWGLYAERLADEMGLYSRPLDRLGMLSFDSLRACRLVVDTGVHALGWSRERARRFLIDNSPLVPRTWRPRSTGTSSPRGRPWPTWSADWRSCGSGPRPGTGSGRSST